jgi:hypothetical protein
MTNRNVGLIDESGSIYRAISEDFKRRMRNWVRSRDGALVSTSLNPNGPMIPSEIGLYEKPINILFGEADDTESALTALPARYQRAVRQFWRFEGATLREHARKIVLYMDDDGHPNLKYETFERWVMKGHELLAVDFARAGMSIAQRRADTERTIDAARPVDPGEHALKLFGLPAPPAAPVDTNA